MIIYILMLIVSLIFVNTANKMNDKKKKIVFYFLSAIPFFIVAAIRYDVGTDYSYRYVPDFKTILKGKDVANLEIGFKFIIKFCLLFTKNSQSLFVVTSALITFFIMQTIYKKSNNKVISIILFVLGGFFFQSLNILRQFLAMSMILFASQYLLNRKTIIIYVMSVLVAFTIHSSSIIMLPLLFFKNKIINKPIVIIPLVLIAVIFGEAVIELLEPIISNTRFKVYLVGRYAKGQISILYIIENLAIYIYMLILYKLKLNNNNISNEDYLYINIQGFALIFMAMSSVHMLFSRISYYFMIFQIISIPYFIETANLTELNVLEKVKELDIFKKIIRKEEFINEKNLKKILSTAIIICFMGIFTYTNIINNDNEPLPYKTIFNVEKRK